VSTLRAALVPLALLAWPCALAEDALVFRVAPASTLTRTIESRIAMELDTLRMRVDGEEVPPESFDKLGLTLAHSERCVVTDAFLEVAPEGPRRLRRTFDDLGGEVRTKHTPSEDSSDQQALYASALEGTSVDFVWDEDAAAFVAAFAEGSTGDASLLAGLEEDMDLRRLLPREPVALGATWTIDARALQCLLDPGGDLGLVSEGDTRVDRSRTDAQQRDNLTGAFAGTWTTTDTVDGVRVARIALELDLRTHAELDLAPDGNLTDGKDRIETAFELEGELRWDLDHGHALALELGGSNALTKVESRRGALRTGKAYEFVRTQVFTGEMHIRWDVARR
jgi:hypothetical protein